MYRFRFSHFKVVLQILRKIKLSTSVLHAAKQRHCENTFYMVFVQTADLQISRATLVYQ